MSKEKRRLPAGFPEYLTHSEQDTPVPSWEQIIRGERMIEHVSRLLAGANDRQSARQVWEQYPPGTKRSLALLVDKIYDEGWLGSVGQIRSAWDGGFYFWPGSTLGDLLNSKSGRHGSYIFCSLRNGLFAYLNAWNHKAWRRAWMETDTGSAALHVGIFEDGSAEVHLDLFNPLFIKGAPTSDLVRVPLVGTYNHRQFLLHRRWEQSQYGQITRTSANFYHLMRGQVPLSF